MTYKNAMIILGTQQRNLRKVNNIRIEHNGYEYRITYVGGFGAYVAIDRREIGKRNFKYFGGIGAYNCWTADQVLTKAMELIEMENLRKKH